MLFASSNDMSSQTAAFRTCCPIEQIRADLHTAIAQVNQWNLGQADSFQPLLSGLQVYWETLKHENKHIDTFWSFLKQVSGACYTQIRALAAACKSVITSSEVSVVWRPEVPLQDNIWIRNICIQSQEMEWQVQLINLSYNQWPASITEEEWLFQMERGIGISLCEATTKWLAMHQLSHLTPSKESKPVSWMVDFYDVTMQIDSCLSQLNIKQTSIPSMYSLLWETIDPDTRLTYNQIVGDGTNAIVLEHYDKKRVFKLALPGYTAKQKEVDHKLLIEARDTLVAGMLGIGPRVYEVKQIYVPQNWKQDFVQSGYQANDADSVKRLAERQVYAIVMDRIGDKKDDQKTDKKEVVDFLYQALPSSMNLHRQLKTRMMWTLLLMKQFMWCKMHRIPRDDMTPSNYRWSESVEEKKERKDTTTSLARGKFQTVPKVWFIDFDTFPSLSAPYMVTYRDYATQQTSNLLYRMFSFNGSYHWSIPKLSSDTNP
jgi:hypothetical protein